MKSVILIIFSVLLSPNIVNSQQDTSLTPMESAIIELLDALYISDKVSEFITHDMDSLMRSMHKEFPEVNLQMERIIREEIVKYVEDAVSPNGDFFILISDVYSKYFTADEVKIFAASIKSGGGINDSNIVAISKFVTLKDSISNDYTKASKIFMKNLKYKFTKKIKRRFEEEGIIDDERGWMMD